MKSFTIAQLRKKRIIYYVVEGRPGAMGTAQASEVGEEFEAVRVTRENAAGQLVILCDHASNFVPDEFGSLGLGAADLARHIAWDPGALPVARLMAERLDAVLVESGVSRLVVDCNRACDARDLVPAISEATAVPGNLAIDAEERTRRIALAHTPFHAAVDRVLAGREAACRGAAVISVHTFTPVYNGVKRPWHVGILHDDDERLAGPMLEALSQLDGVAVGDNQPYSPADGVYYSLERHARARGLPCAMIEIRNDEVATAAGQTLWADRLVAVLARTGYAA